MKKVLPTTLAAAALTLAVVSCQNPRAGSMSSNETHPVSTAPAAKNSGGFVSRDGKAEDAIENHYPFPIQKPTTVEVTQVLLKLVDHIDRKYPAVVTDNKTKKEITDFSTVNPDARVTPGGYPFGVIHAGMVYAYGATGEKRFADFTAKRLALIGDHLDYWKKQYDQIGNQSSVRNFFAPNSLDACGAWGSALVKAQQANIGPNLRPVIDTWANYVHTKQFRLPDGTLARKSPPPESVWGDDMYMSIPLLTQYYKLTGDAAYLDDAAKQAIQISARLFKPAKGVYTHGWLSNNQEYQQEFYWGRINGWCIMANCELLDNMPENHPQREEVLRILRTHIKGLNHLQSSLGLWHQLLDREDSYLETSCTAMFTYSIAHAVNKGWIDPSYGGSAIVGWSALLTRQNAEGGFDGTCVGTNIAFDNLYYYHRPATDDVHGYGPILHAGAEIIKMINNENLSITYGRGGYYSVTAKKSGAATQPR